MWTHNGEVPHWTDKPKAAGSSQIVRPIFFLLFLSLSLYKLVHKKMYKRITTYHKYRNPCRKDIVKTYRILKWIRVQNGIEMEWWTCVIELVPGHACWVVSGGINGRLKIISRQITVVWANIRFWDVVKCQNVVRHITAEIIEKFLSECFSCSRRQSLVT